MDYNSIEDDSFSPFPLWSDQPVTYNTNHVHAASIKSGYLSFSVDRDHNSSVNSGLSQGYLPYDAPFLAQTRQDDGTFDNNYSSSFSTFRNAYSSSDYSTSFSTLDSWRTQPSSVTHSTSFSPSESSGLQPSFVDRSSPRSIIDYSQSFSAQTSHSSFASWPKYDGFPDYDQNTTSKSFSTYEESIRGPTYRLRLPDTSPSPATAGFDIDVNTDEMLLQLQSSVTGNTIRIIQKITQNIQNTIDEGLTKRRRLSAKINRLKYQIDGPILPTAVDIKRETFHGQGSSSVDAVTKETENRRGRQRGSGTTARKVAGRRVAHIKPQYSQDAILRPPRRNPYKTDEEHELEVKEYQAVFKKRHQVEGYEILYSFTDDHIDRLMGRLAECNLMETTVNNFLEGRALVEQGVLLLEIKGFIASAEKDLKEILECFAQLNDISL